jgi:glycosyltransferase involved in cell wall biosynthesis
LPQNLLRFRPKPGEYLAFIGRFSPEKRADRAIEIARRAGLPLKLAAKVDAVDKAYFESRIKPLLDDPLIEYIGEIGEDEKDEFLGNAYALLFPIDWPEPFGLVMIESMACGTPVIAYRNGSVEEVMEEGRSGFMVSTLAEAVKAVRRVADLDRAECRRVFERRFTAAQMAADYVRVYERVIATSRRRAA